MPDSTLTAQRLDPVTVRTSFRRRSIRSHWVVRYFYAYLFTKYPEVRDMFPVAMEQQRERLFAALCGIVERVDDPSALAGYLTSLGASHRRFNLQPWHYAAVGDSLIATLRFLARDTWTVAEENQWLTAYDIIASGMSEAAAAVIQFPRQGRHRRPDSPHCQERAQTSPIRLSTDG